jgi:hypothetical protein
MGESQFLDKGKRGKRSVLYEKKKHAILFDEGYMKGSH